MGANGKKRVRTRRSRGTRVVVFVLVVMAVGFVVQTGLAFGIAVFGVTEGQIPLTAQDAELARIYRDADAAGIIGFRWQGVHVVHAIPTQAGELKEEPALFRVPSWTVFPPAGSTTQHTTIAFGWPLPSWLGAEPRPGGQPGMGGATTGSSLLKGLDPSGAHPLPTIPIPLNTLTNSAFYGVIVAGVWLIVRKARRAWRRRVRPGTCTHCGYALAGLPAVAPCPECGRER